MNLAHFSDGHAEEIFWHIELTDEIVFATPSGVYRYVEYVDTIENERGDKFNLLRHRFLKMLDDQAQEAEWSVVDYIDRIEIYSGGEL